MSNALLFAAQNGEQTMKDIDDWKNERCAAIRGGKWHINHRESR